MDLLEKLMMFDEVGYIYHDCPECNCETENCEPDADQAFCSNCDKVVKVDPII